jgi:hypothetical protein
MIRQLFKWFFKGLLLAACFAGGYYWSLALKSEAEGRDAGYRMRDGALRSSKSEAWVRETGIALRDRGREMLDAVRGLSDAAGVLPEEKLAVDTATLTPEAETPPASAIAEPESTEPNALRVAMRNHIEALRSLGK